MARFAYLGFYADVAAALVAPIHLTSTERSAVASLFAQAWTSISGQFDTTFGDNTRVEPRLAGEFIAGGLDPDRPAYEIVGIVRRKPVDVQIRSSLGSSTGDRANIRGEIIGVAYRFAALGIDRTKWPRKGDRIVLLDEPGIPALLISKTDRDGVDHWLCACVPESTA